MELECNLYNKGLRESDEKVFQALFIKYYPKLKGFIIHIVKVESIAEELSQEIFVNIWEKRQELPQIKSWNAYLYRAAKNSSINFLKRKNLEDSYLSTSMLKSNPYDTGVEEDYIAREMELLVKLTVESMPTQRKKIFELSRFENKTNQEIADELKISKKTVENHMTLAIRDIKKTIFLFSLFFIQ